MKFLILGGLHRSGTSLIHEILKEHVDVGGISGSPAMEDEGQHLQTVFKAANKYGGPGKFAFNSLAYMDENHPLASSENGQKIIREWARFGDFNRNYFIEKSPPNLIRFRFFQKIWPDIRAVMIFRHPLAVSYATQKWCSTDIISLLDHTLTAYEIFMQDKPYLKNIIEIKYEDFVKNPQEEIDKVYDYLSIPSCRITHNIRSDVNKKYYDMWESNIDILSRVPLMKKGVPSSLEIRANKFGYSLRPGNYILK